MDIQHRFRTNVKSMNVNIGYKNRLKYTIWHRFLRKSMLWCTYNIDFSDKPMLNCIFWNTFYIGSVKPNVESYIQHQFLKKTDIELYILKYFLHRFCKKPMLKIIYNIGFWKNRYWMCLRHRFLPNQCYFFAKFSNILFISTSYTFTLHTSSNSKW